MPKVHKAANQETPFSVSPWQSKKDRHRHAHVATDYSEIFVDLTAASERKAAVLSQQGPAVTYKEQSAPQPPAWRKRRRGDAATAQPEQEESSKFELPEAELPCGEAEESLERAPGRPAWHTFTGLGYVALLSNGQCIGHLVDSRSRHQLGLSGVELLAERECTRDPDWQLMRLTLVSFASGAEATFLTERTGMSAARLRAPLDMQCNEEELLRDFAAPGDASLAFTFDCETVLAYEAADAHLRRFHPSWCGLDAVVSLGRFSCSGEGLAALLQAKPLDTRELYDSDLDR